MLVVRQNNDDFSRVSGESSVELASKTSLIIGHCKKFKLLFFIPLLASLSLHDNLLGFLWEKVVVGLSAKQ